MSLLEKICFIAFVVLLPTQLTYHFWPTWAFFSGLPVDYLAPTIYLTDLFILALLLLSHTKIKLPLWLLPICLINIIFSISPLASIFHWLKIFEIIFLYQYLSSRPNLLKQLPSLLFISAIWSSTIALLQFINQTSLNGLFYWLGERTFSLTTSSIAASDIFGIRTLRPYATFSHPNVLAGFISAIALLILHSKSDSLIKFFVSLITSFTLLLTVSKSAALALIICLIYPNIKTKLRFLIFILFLLPIFIYLYSLPSSTIRLNLILESTAFSFSHLITGTGLGTNVLTTSNSLALQPVHNVYLILLAELGLPVLIFLIYKFKFQLIRFIKYPPLLAIIIISIFDHYWLTQQQTLLLLTMLLAYFRLKFPQPNTGIYDPTSNKL